MPQLPEQSKQMYHASSSAGFAATADNLPEPRNRLFMSGVCSNMLGMQTVAKVPTSQLRFSQKHIDEKVD